MCSEPISKDRPPEDSLTDQILKFCASGQFGVREAIAAARMDKEKRKKPAPSPPAQKKTP